MILKGILSRQRVGSNTPHVGKENFPDGPQATVEDKPSRQGKSKKSKTKEQPAVDGGMTSQAFDELMDEMQIPPALRSKLDTMTPGVKAEFLKSSHLVTAKTPQTPRTLRRPHSIESLSSPRTGTVRHAFDESDLPRLAGPSFVTPAHIRGVSFDAGRQAFRSPVEPVPAPVKAAKDKRAKGGTTSSAKYCNILTSTSTVRLEIETVQKLRMLLRNEAASWTEDFLNVGGYAALLTRLNEILEVEWREEQHDDKILHELLRCFKALSTSAVGCVALRSYSPAPYSQLISLLYSDKRPGEVGTRQLIMELLLILFDLYPPSSLPAAGSPTAGRSSHVHARSRSVPWESTSWAASSSNLVTLPAPHTTVCSFIRMLLLTPAPRPAEGPEVTVEPHAFITELHIPRIYKTYVQELSDVCRDFFWVFCHNDNTIWNLDQTDEGKVEKPRAPGGMTGGVEFEAMTYLTTHLKFINALAQSARGLALPPTHELSAYRLHNDLFLSGLERILLMARKASTTYYPMLHLEIARYVANAVQAGFELPWALARYIGAPPSSMRKPGAGRPLAHSGLGHGSPTKRNGVVGASGLPDVRKVTPMFGL
ncbi:armadillo-type protein [Amylocystis lapponica]|nr:armadillo-type protein [Amylocystis lapponica]